MKRVVLLKHREESVGICVFTSPAASLKCRSRYFGLSGPRCRESLREINEQLWLLARVVLHPSYRGAGLASRFIEEACRSSPVPWIECLSALGRVHPVFERAGFQKVGVIRKGIFGSISRGGQFGARCRRKPSEERSRFSEPAYYVLSVNDETVEPRIGCLP